MKDFTAVILAAGLGTRMKTDTPKVMHKVGSETILARVVSSLRKAGIEKMIAVIGYKAELIESSFKEQDITFVRQEELLGSGDALARAVPHLEEDGNVLVTCGDAPLISEETFSSMIKIHEGEDAAATLLTCRIDDGADYGRVVRDDGGNVLKIVEAKDLEGRQKEINEVNVGTYCFKNADIRKFISEIKINEKKQEFYLTDMVDILVSRDRKVSSVECREEEFIGINSRKELAMANKIVNRKVLDKLMEAGVTIVDPDSTYVDESVRIGRDTTIYPCTVIEENVEISSGCKIGPFARLRPGTRLAENVEVGNYVELCRTQVSEGTKVKHHTYLGDTAVGKNVNVGAGVITANYDGKSKSRTEIGDEAFIGVGAILIAPVKIGKGATIGAGSVVTKNSDVPEKATVIGVPAKIMEKS